MTSSGKRDEFDWDESYDGGRLVVRHLGIDTHQEPVAYMREDCGVCRSEGFEAQSRIQVSTGTRSIIATLNIVRDSLLEEGEAGLSDAGWRLLNARDGQEVSVRHPEPLDSLSHLRSRIYGNRLGEEEFRKIIHDVVLGRYADIHLSAFLTACAAEPLDADEIAALTRSMVDTGDRLSWEVTPVMDKHGVGGLPGNRVTPVLVAIAASCGLTIPKTSSRAITSPSGTADAMETLAPVELDLPLLRRVVEQEGGCLAWGGAVRLSPADDILIRVERVLDLDSEGQLVASVLSKKVAAGSTHVLMEMPVGPTAKVRDQETARHLTGLLQEVGRRHGLTVRVEVTDGSGPVGRGIGPALEARDVLAVLQNEDHAPEDLREKSLHLAGALLEMAGVADEEAGTARARQVLESGAAWEKFQAICRAQGGMREPPRAAHYHDIEAPRSGRLDRIDNRLISRVAKLAGAPAAKAAGVELQARPGDRVEEGQPLFTVHAEAPGELEYALEFIGSRGDIVHVRSQEAEGEEEPAS